MASLRRYTEQAMQSALEEVNQGNTSLRGASRKNGIPLTSFNDRLSGKLTRPPWSNPTKLSMKTKSENLVISPWKGLDLAFDSSQGRK